MLKLRAPAKLNLTLEVLCRRPDSYHEIRSVLQTVNLSDSIHFRLDEQVTFKCDMPEWSTDESLVSRAIRLLQDVTGYAKGGAIDIEKRIPLTSGLGGDSSDAAAVLRGLNEMWRLGLSSERLLELAARLGSDVPFFLRGGTALAEGRGEKVTALPSLTEMLVVLVVPDVPVKAGKTTAMYNRLQPAHYTNGSITERLVSVLNEGRVPEPSLLFNTFENVAFEHFTNLSVYKEHFTKLGAPSVHLAGSGPALFTMLDDGARAGELYTRCKDQGMEVYLAETEPGYEEP